MFQKQYLSAKIPKVQQQDCKTLLSLANAIQDQKTLSKEDELQEKRRLLGPRTNSVGLCQGLDKALAALVNDPDSARSYVTRLLQNAHAAMKANSIPSNTSMSSALPQLEQQKQQSSSSILLKALEQVIASRTTSVCTESPVESEYQEISQPLAQPQLSHQPSLSSLVEQKFPRRQGQ